MKTKIVQKLTVAKYLLLAGVRVLAIAISVVLGVMNAPIEAQSLQFDVVSIRPKQGPLGRSQGLRYTPGKVASDGGITTKRLIELAYRLTPYQISGGPDWIDSDVFEIQATTGMPAAGCKGTPCLPTPETLQMLQSLLADRFKLSVRHETKELPVYGLIVGKNGLKPSLRLLKEGEEISNPSGFQHVNPNNFGGHTGRGMNPNGISMQQFAETLGALSDESALAPTVLGRPVLDRTNLQGRYHFVFLWKDDGDLIPALEDELGFTLTSQRAAMDTIVIDHIEKPSAN